MIPVRLFAGAICWVPLEVKLKLHMSEWTVLAPQVVYSRFTTLVNQEPPECSNMNFLPAPGLHTAQAYSKQHMGDCISQCWLTLFTTPRHEITMLETGSCNA